MARRRAGGITSAASVTPSPPSLPTPTISIFDGSDIDYEWTGEPEFADVVVEFSADGLSGWTTEQTIADSHPSGTFTAAETAFYRVRLTKATYTDSAPSNVVDIT